MPPDASGVVDNSCRALLRRNCAEHVMADEHTGWDYRGLDSQPMEVDLFRRWRRRVSRGSLFSLISRFGNNPRNLSPKGTLSDQSVTRTSQLPPLAMR
jgi:hypothetical protein